MHMGKKKKRGSYALYTYQASSDDSLLYLSRALTSFNLEWNSLILKKKNKF